MTLLLRQPDMPFSYGRNVAEDGGIEPRGVTHPYASNVVASHFAASSGWRQDRDSNPDTFYREPPLRRGAMPFLLTLPILAEGRRVERPW